MKCLNLGGSVGVYLLGLAALSSCSGVDAVYLDAMNLEAVELGSASMELQLAPGVSVSTLSWSVSRAESGFSRSGSVDVRLSNRIAFQIGNLPSGEGYAISLSASSLDSSFSCSGSASFSIAPHASTQVSLALLCSAARSDVGSAVVSASTQLCASIESIDAAPLETSVGGSIALAATARAGNITPTYAWSATAGSFDNASSATPLFTCPPAPETVTLTLSVAPSGPGCEHSSESLEVRCGTLDPTFTNLYASVISQRCISCHRPGGGGVNTGRLDLSTQASAYSNLVGVAAQGTGAGTSGVTCGSVTPPLTRVIASDSASSLLFSKVNSKLLGVLAPCGSPMPTPATAAPLTAGQVALVKAWIDAGARSD